MMSWEVTTVRDIPGVQSPEGSVWEKGCFQVSSTTAIEMVKLPVLETLHLSLAERQTF